jgi:cytoskeletal protein CcmA (bactofilin family)
MANKERDSQENNIIGQSTFIEGTIKSQGNIRIDGRIRGTVSTKGNFIIGLTGEIEGHSHAKNITISGKFDGNIEAVEKLILENNSKVTGDINTRRLVIDDGAIFNGNCTMKPSEEN